MRIRLALLMILLGLGGIVVAASVLFSSWNRQMSAGFGITVPDTVDLDLAGDEPNVGEMVVWREVAGTHATVNRPVLDPPPDLGVGVTDRRTGEAIPTRPYQWNVRQRLLPGFERWRRALVAFDPPAHGQVTIAVTGAFPHEQVYRVAPAVEKWGATTARVAIVTVGVGLLSILAGIALLLSRALGHDRNLPA